MEVNKYFKDDDKDLYKIFWTNYQKIHSKAPAYGVKDLKNQPTTSLSWDNSIGVSQSKNGKEATFNKNLFDKVN